jgi:hypothetical protein
MVIITLQQTLDEGSEVQNVLVYGFQVVMAGVNMVYMVWMVLQIIKVQVPILRIKYS